MPTVNPMTEAELGRLVPPDDAGFGVLSCPRGGLPLTAMTIDARVHGLVVELEIEQVFANTLGEPIEATYVFPLPDRAAVTRFRMEVGGRVVDGVIEERGLARAEYDAAIAAGYRAAITEEDRAGVFTMRVGNLVPGDVARIRLALTGPLPVDDGEATFRFPLVVAPRYIPGHALPGPSAGTGTGADTDAVPDASRITPPVLLPGVANPVRLAIKLTIDPAGLPVTGIRSSLHAVTETTRAGVHAIELVPGERLDRDFIVRWSVGDAAVRSSLVVAADADGRGGTFLLTLVPPRGDERRPRDVVFVIDRSGSMGGWKMVAARRAVARMVDTLGERDRFAVMAFDNTVDAPADLPTGALAAAGDRNRFRAVEFLSRLEARGGTEMAEPLTRAADLLAGGHDDRDRVLVLATDGQVGNEDQILRQLGPRLRNVRTFALGIDQAVNAAFLRRLAALGGGACELVESEDRLDAVMDKVHRRIATPVVTEVAVAADALHIEAGSIAPHRLPALFAGAPVVISGRLGLAPATGGAAVEGGPFLGGASAGWIELTGRLPGGGAWRERVAVSSVDAGPAVPAMWARARVRDLEDRYAIGGGDRVLLEREIVHTSVRWSVLSLFTAFLAVDRDSKVNPGGVPRPVTQPVETPAGWAAGGGPVPALAAMPAAPTGWVTRTAGSKAVSGMPPGPRLAAPLAAPPPAAPQAPAASQAPAGAPRSRTTSGLLGKAMSLFQRAGSEGEGGLPAAVDDAPYRQRAGEIADAIDRALAVGGGLGLVRERLRELIEDVRSVGGLDPLAAALAALLARLEAAGDAAAAASPVVSELRTLAQGAAMPGRGSFWK
jgi:Ca-activated chloride channel family protein